MNLKLIPIFTALFMSLMLPAALHADVRDNANIFSQSAVEDATSAMKKMERVQKKMLVVETFGGVPDDQKDAAKENPGEYFKKWMASRATELQVNGVYVLICMDPHHLEVGVGRETLSRGEFTDADRNSLYAQMKQDLHDKDYDKALSDAVDNVQRAFTANINAPANRSSSNGGETGYSNGQSQSQGIPGLPGASTGAGLSIGSLICLGVAGVIIFSLIRSVFRGAGTGGGYGGGGYAAGGQNYGGNYGGGGFGYGGGGGGSGFGRGLLGGLLGGALGGYAADRFDHRNDQGNAGVPQSDNSGGGGGAFDPGPSDAGQGFGDSAIGGDFGSSGGGDSGGGGGSSGGDF